jgi:hypothetical protein
MCGLGPKIWKMIYFILFLEKYSSVKQIYVSMMGGQKLARRFFHLHETYQNGILRLGLLAM